jgi:hypothetical protein
MNKVYSIAGFLLVIALLGLSGCEAEPVTTTVLKTVTAPAQTITATSTFTAAPQTVTVTETKTVTATAPATSSVTKTTSPTTSATSETTRPVNDQPQVITSDDGKVQILNHELIISGFGDRKVAGAVKNLTEDKISAEVTVKFWAADDTLIDTQVEIVSDIYAGKTKRFEPLYSGDLRGSVVYYTISVTSIS